MRIIEWPLAEYMRYVLAVIPMSAWNGRETFMVDRRDLAMKYAVPFEQWMAEYRE